MKPYYTRHPIAMVQEFMKAFESDMPEQLEKLVPITDETLDRANVLAALGLARAQVRNVFANKPVRRLCVDLIFEEFIELIEAELDGNVVEVADALGDLEYVTQFAALKTGIPLGEVFEEIHRSNMTKLDANGKPIRNASGKIMKGPNYEPPKIAAILQGELCTR